MPFEIWQIVLIAISATATLVVGLALLIPLCYEKGCSRIDQRAKCDDGHKRCPLHALQWQQNKNRDEAHGVWCASSIVISNDYEADMSDVRGWRYRGCQHPLECMYCSRSAVNLIGETLQGLMPYCAFCWEKHGPPRLKSGVPIRPK